MTNDGNNFAAMKNQIKVFDDLDGLTVRIGVGLGQIGDLDISPVSIDGHVGSCLRQL